MYLNWCYLENSTNQFMRSLYFRLSASLFFVFFFLNISHSQIFDVSQLNKNDWQQFRSVKDISVVKYKDYKMSGDLEVSDHQYSFPVHSRLIKNRDNALEYTIITEYEGVLSVWMKSEDVNYSILVSPENEITEMDVEFDQGLTCSELSDHDHYGEEEDVEDPLKMMDACAASPICSGINIDLMVVFSLQTSAAHGGIPGVTAAIGSSITEMNMVFSNSLVSHYYNPVLIREVNYSETGDGGTDLWNLRNQNDGIMDEVHVWRDQYGADLVALIVNGSNVCGVAYRPGNPLFPNDQQGFSLTAYGCMTGNLTFPHELGHNLGATHDRYVSSNGLCGFFYGYVNENFPDGGSSRWRTVLAYTDECSDAGVSCPRIPNLSNPDVFHNGDPTGKPITDPESANNAYGLERSACYVAQYRDEVTCTDGILNGDETEIDCGGPNCPACICPNIDYAALAQIYTDMGGANWNNKNGWNTDNSYCEICDWHGVTCDGAGRVIELKLNGNNLTGNLSTSIGLLSNLQVLEMSGNPGITGQIPVDVSTLLFLEKLDLSANNLSGNLPGFLNAMIALQYLDLSQNLFSNEIPVNLSFIPQLDHLDLSDNLLSGELPEQLGYPPFPSLMDLSNNDLVGCFPVEYLNMCNSVNANFFGNTGLPSNGDFNAFCNDYSGLCCVLTVNTEATGTSCGVDNGEISIAVPEAFEPYTMYLNGEEIMETDLDSLPSGEYELIVTDNFNCQHVETIEVTASTNLNVSQVVSQANCGSADGSIELVVQNSNGPVLFAFQGGDLDTVSLFDNLGSGTYQISAVDSLNCLYLADIVVDETDGIEASAMYASTTCGESNGSILIEIESSNGSSTVWLNGDELEDLSVDNLSPGTYEIVIMDSLACSWTMEMEIEESTIPEMIVSTQNFICGQQEGMISIDYSTDNSPFEILVNGELTDSQELDNLKSGDYEIIITDAVGCVSQEMVTISLEGDLILSLDMFQSISCPDVCNGSVNLTTNSSVVNWIWSDGVDRGNSVTDLCVGTYTVTAIDENGCEGEISFDIEASNVSMVNSEIINTQCNQMTGSITLSNTQNLNLSWSNGSTGSTIQDLAAGIYEVTVNDIAGCEYIQNFEIISEDGPVLSPELNSISCYGLNDGAISINPTGGSAPYEIVWSDESMEQNRVGLAPGFYEVIVTDENGCSVSQNFEIVEPTEIQNTLTIQNLNCFGDTDGWAQIETSGGTGTLTVEWSNGVDGNAVEGLSAGSYSVMVFDENNCVISESFEITEPTELVTVIDQAGDVLSVDPNGGVMPYTYQWSTESTESMINVDEEGWYYVDVTDANGCTTTDSIFYNASSTQFQKLVDIKISPNPFSETFMIEFNTDFEIDQITIYDHTGKLIKNISALVSTKGILEINMSEELSGLYIVKLLSGSDYITKQMIKI